MGARREIPKEDFKIGDEFWIEYGKMRYYEIMNGELKESIKILN